MASLSEDQNPVLEIDGTLNNNNSNSKGNKDKEKAVVLVGEENRNSNTHNQQGGSGGGGGEREMPSMHRSGSRPQLDLSKAAIQGNFEVKDPTILLPNQSDDISHLALDIGGNTLNKSALLLLLFPFPFPSMFSFLACIDSLLPFCCLLYCVTVSLSSHYLFSVFQSFTNVHLTNVCMHTLSFDK